RRSAESSGTSDFMRCGALDVDDDQETLAICDGHDLRPLAALRADAGTARLAGAKLPSMNASCGSSGSYFVNAQTRWSGSLTTPRGYPDIRASPVRACHASAHRRFARE